MPAISGAVNLLLDLSFTFFRKIDKKVDQLTNEVTLVKDQVTQLGSILDLDLKQETKETIHRLDQKLDKILTKNFSEEIPAFSTSHRTAWYYGNAESLKPLHTEKPTTLSQFLALKEIIDYWKKRFKEETDFSEQQKLITMMQQLYTEHETVFKHHNYNLFEETPSKDTHETSSEILSEEDDELIPVSKKVLDEIFTQNDKAKLIAGTSRKIQPESSKTTQPSSSENFPSPDNLYMADTSSWNPRRMDSSSEYSDTESNTELDTESDVELETTRKGKRKIGDKDHLDTDEDFQPRTTEDDFTEHLKATDDSKDFVPNTPVFMTRKDDLNKGNVASGGTYLDLTHVPFKQYESAINDWAQSLSIVITSFESTWSRKKFLDWVSGTLQGSVLHFLKQWESTPEGQAAKELLQNSMKSFDALLSDIVKLLKNEFCGLRSDEQTADDITYALSKLKLCNMNSFEEFSKTFQQYYHLLPVTSTKHWLSQFFAKLPPPWDTICKDNYPKFCLETDSTDTLGNQINYVYRQLINHCLDARAAKQLKKKLNPGFCKSLIKNNWEFGCEKTYKKKCKSYKISKPMRPYRRRYRWKRFNPQNRFFKQKKYVRKSNPNNKTKSCRCYACNEEGHYANKCPQKNKGARKMVKQLEVKNLEIVFGDDITNSSEILYELVSETDSDSGSESDGIFEFKTLDVPTSSDDPESLKLEECFEQAPPEETNQVRLSNFIQEDMVVDFSKYEKHKSIRKDEVYRLSKLPLWSTRYFEQASGNTTARLTENSKIEIKLFNKEKIMRLCKKHPQIRYIHIGVIQIEITALFRQGIDTPILAFLFDKRFIENPASALIGGIDSNLVVGNIWFRIKPNYFVSVTDPNIEDTLVLRIKTEGLGMKSNSENLAISWTAIHELTNVAKTSIKPIDKRIVEIFEPKPFETEIQPRLINWHDLSIPKQWLLNDILPNDEQKFPTLEIVASGKNLYFQRQISETQNMLPQSISPLKIEEPKSIATKTVQIPIRLGSGSTSSKGKGLLNTDELKTFAIYHQTFIDDDEYIFSAKQSKKKYLYVQAKFYFPFYKPYTLDVLLDTGATTCCGRWQSLPTEQWIKLKTPIPAIGIDGHPTFLEYKAKNVPVILGNEKFIIPKILCFPIMHGDFILGNNFTRLYLPMEWHKHNIILTSNKKVKIPILPHHVNKCETGFTPVPHHILTLDETHWMFPKLKDNFSDNPLHLWDRSPRYCTLKLNDPTKVIRVNPIIYTLQDIQEFDNQLKDLLDKGLIEPTSSPHSCPAFLVRNHAEIKRGKARMVINYKSLNKHLIFDGYFIHEKTS